MLNEQIVNSHAQVDLTCLCHLHMWMLNEQVVHITWTFYPCFLDMCHKMSNAHVE